MRLAGWMLAGALLALSGCKTNAPAGSAEQTPAAAQPSASQRPAVALDPATLGDASGTVRFNGKAPAALPIDTSMDPACGLSGGTAQTEQIVAKDGKLANVFVYVKAGPPTAMNAPAQASAPVVLDQKGCVYTPHVVAVMRGGSVEFHNDDPTMHNIHTMPAVAGNAAVDVSQGPRGTPQVKQFNEPEVMMPVRCNMHPWMNAFINVSATPFFAVTDAAGHFDLRGLPAGDYTLGAAQEKLGEQTVQITVRPHATVTASLSFGGR